MSETVTMPMFSENIARGSCATTPGHGRRGGRVRFSGRIRFPEAGEDDLGVTIEVTESHVRIRTADQVLGSWCLADVVAKRVVANEFEIDLGGDVLSFVADDQVNFAYGAVQAMAEGWARYHAMNPVKRKAVVAGARRSNEKPRLAETRVALAVPVVMIDEPRPAPAAVENENGHDPGERRFDRDLLRPPAPGVGDLTVEEPVEPSVGPTVLPVPRTVKAAAKPVLGAFGDGHHPAETSGLRAGMRSVFTRRGDHDHSYVTSTTAVGITRRVCLDCGHVSIGATE